MRRRQRCSVVAGVLKLTGRFSGISNWTDDYSVVVAGFNDKSEYAVITKSLPVNVTDGTDIVMTLGGISDEVKSLKLCVISRLRECIVEFKTMEDEELTAVTDTILMDGNTGRGYVQFHPVTGFR